MHPHSGSFLPFRGVHKFRASPDRATVNAQVNALVKVHVHVNVNVNEGPDG